MLIDRLLISLQSSEFLNNVCDPELHHHAHCFDLCDFVKKRFQFLDVVRVLLERIIEFFDHFFSSLEILDSNFSEDATIPFNPAFSLSFKCVDD